MLSLPGEYCRLQSRQMRPLFFAKGILQSRLEQTVKFDKGMLQS